VNIGGSLMSKNNKNIAKKENLKNTQKRADIRKRLDREKRRKRDKIFLISMIAVALLVVGLYLTTTTFSGSSNNNSNSDDIQPEPAVDSPKSTGENDIRIKISDVNDGQAHFYSYDSNGVDIRYFVLESNDGKIRAAFDILPKKVITKKVIRWSVITVALNLILTISMK
jgi:uncharacterized membrane protein